MDLTIIAPADLYRARVEQCEREYLGHQLLQQEIKTNPDLTGDEQQKALDDSAAAVAQIEIAHQAATQLLADVQANQPTPTVDDTPPTILPAGG